MVSLYNLCNFYLILALSITCTDAANITAARGSSVCLPCASDLYNIAQLQLHGEKMDALGFYANTV
uniref:Uncharacterized protein n=1 Tax=Anguilla anguilla TaxID=7936 RepID=A0A0E9XSQ8_ANGAN